MSTMGKNLSGMLVNMTDLILKETNVARMKELRKQHKALGKQLQTLIDNTVPNDTASYRQATKALLEANEEMKEAKKDLDRVGKVITKSAKAVDLMAKVLKTVI